MKKGQKRKRKPLPITISEEEFTELLEATRSMHHKVAFTLAWCSGLRLSEITGLTKNDFDLENKRIMIREGKGLKDRVVGLPAIWTPRLMDYIPIPCSNRSLQNAFQTYSKRCGLAKKKPGVHFHSLRHGYATYQFQKGTKLPFIQQLLGHEDISTTMIYVNLSPEEALKAHHEAY